MQNFDLNACGVEEMTQQEMVIIEGGNIFKSAWNGIKTAAEWVAAAAEYAWYCIEDYCSKHSNDEPSSYDHSF